VASRLAAFAEVHTGMAKGGIESNTSHWAKRPEEQLASNGVSHAIDAVLPPK